MAVYEIQVMFLYFNIELCLTTREAVIRHSSTERLRFIRSVLIASTHLAF